MIFQIGKKNIKEEHFKELFLSMYPKLVRYATLLMEDVDDAKDIVSGVMEEAWKRFDEIEEKTRYAWLYTAVRNGCLNRLKHLNVEQQYLEEIIEATQKDVDSQYWEHEFLLQQAEQIASDLPEPTRTILQLCYWKKQTYKQVAEQLGISPDTVKKHISKALKILRETMKGSKV